MAYEQILLETLYKGVILGVFVGKTVCVLNYAL